MSSLIVKSWSSKLPSGPSDSAHLLLWIGLEWDLVVLGRRWLLGARLFYSKKEGIWVVGLGTVFWLIWGFGRLAFCQRKQSLLVMWACRRRGRTVRVFSLVATGFWWFFWWARLELVSENVANGDGVLGSGKNGETGRQWWCELVVCCLSELWAAAARVLLKYLKNKVNRQRNRGWDWWLFGVSPEMISPLSCWPMEMVVRTDREEG